MRTPLNRWLEFAFGVALPAALTVFATIAVVFIALNRMSNEVNEQDLAHLRMAAKGVLTSALESLGKTTVDYAGWTDAADALYGDINQDFVTGNLLEPTGKGRLFDMVLLVDASGKVLLNLHDGKANPPDSPLIDADDVAALIADQPAQAEVASKGYVRTTDGPALAAARIVTRTDGTVPEGAAPRLLLLAQNMRSDDLRQSAQAFGLDNFSIAGVTVSQSNSVALRSISGQPLANVIWQPRDPGSLALGSVMQPLAFVIGLLALMMGFLVLTVWKVLSDLQAGERNARRDSLHDALSGLPNRASFHRALDARMHQSDLTAVTVLFADLDGFKDVNDTYGHEAGDRLIRAVAAGFHCLLDGQGVLARLGGDEFAMVLSGPNSRTEAVDIGLRMIEFLDQPLDLGGRSVKVGCSVGVASTDGLSLNSVELVRRADVAMYAAKAGGKNRVEIYDDTMDEDRKSQAEMAFALRQAIDRGELQVHYQAVIDARSGEIVTVEALVRWIRPGVGPISPSVFLPVAEEASLTERLGIFVLNRAVGEAKAFGDCRVVVNLFADQFKNPQFPEQVAAILRREGLPANRLELDIPEHFLTRHPERAERMIAALHDLGVHIALDDFGTGFSSISYLRRFAFDKVKIDRSVVIDVVKDQASQQLVRSTVALADALGVAVTAEGIELPDEAQALIEAGCQELQGYHFGAPTVASEIIRRLQRQQDARIDTLRQQATQLDPARALATAS